MGENEAFEAVLEAMSDGLCLLDAEGRLLAANSRFATLLGAEAQPPSPPMDLLAMAGWLQRHGTCEGRGGAQPAAPLLRCALAGAVACEFRRRDGQLLLLSAGPDPRGGCLVLLAERRPGGGGGRSDLTRLPERVHDLNRLLLDIAGVILVFINVDHSVAMLNRKAEEILGIPQAETLGRNWFDSFALPEEREQQRATFAAFLTGRHGERLDGERTVLTRRGEVRLIAWHHVLLRSTSGAVLGSWSSGEDITERRAAERKRDELRMLLESTAQAAPGGLLVTDLHGRYLYWNKRYQEMWGLSDEYLELRRTSPQLTRELLAPLARKVSDPEAFLARTLDMHVGALPALHDEEILLNTGRIFIRFATRVSGGDPPITAIAWIYSDRTEARRREAELAQTQRLAAIAQLSGGIAHELNNLLTVVYGNLDLIQAMAPQNESVRQLTEPAIAAVHRGANLTQSLLAYSRQQPLAPRPTDANALIADMMKTLPMTLGPSISLSFEPGAGLWPILADPSRLQATLMNLATNARDAMPRGGSISIATRNLDLGEGDGRPPEGARGEQVEIAITDEGFGMSAEVVSRAFEPFFTTKDVGKGAGLGLSIVFGFVKQSGGHVVLDSREGQGTTVRLYLPRYGLRPEPGQDAPPHQLSESSNETILLVEDLPAVREVTRSLLDSLGYRVIEAHDGPTALAILRSNAAVDLLLTDIILADGTSGAELATVGARLRPALKVLLHFSSGEAALGDLGSLPPGAALLQRPHRRQDLTQAVQQLLRG